MAVQDSHPVSNSRRLEKSFGDRINQASLARESLQFDLGMSQDIVARGAQPRLQQEIETDIRRMSPLPRLILAGISNSLKRIVGSMRAWSD